MGRIISDDDVVRQSRYRVLEHCCPGRQHGVRERVSQPRRDVGGVQAQSLESLGEGVVVAAGTGAGPGRGSLGMGCSTPGGRGRGQAFGEGGSPGDEGSPVE